MFFMKSSEIIYPRYFVPVHPEKYVDAHYWIRLDRKGVLRSCYKTKVSNNIHGWGPSDWERWVRTKIIKEVSAEELALMTF